MSAGRLRPYPASDLYSTALVNKGSFQKRSFVFKTSFALIVKVINKLMGIRYLPNTFLHTFLFLESSKQYCEVDAFLFVLQRRQLRCRELDLPAFTQQVAEPGTRPWPDWFPKSSVFMSFPLKEAAPSPNDIRK